ncbi:hypothetical protein Lser_V15G19583 [Lactuca serriola]
MSSTAQEVMAVKQWRFPPVSGYKTEVQHGAGRTYIDDFFCRVNYVSNHYGRTRIRPGARAIPFESLVSGGNDELKKVSREHLEQYGEVGLRTLCLAYKDLSPDMYETWNEKFIQSKSALRYRERKLDEVREMAMVSAIQEAQKDNIRNFTDYMMTVLEMTGKRKKRDFLHSLSRISSLARTNVTDSSIRANRSGPILSLTSSPHISSGPSNMELLAIADKKAATYVEVVRKLNDARQRSLEYKSATAFKNAYDNLGLDSSSGNSVTMNKIWHLIQTLTGENSSVQRNLSKKMSLIIGARRHLEWGHDKYIMEMIHSHPAQAALGGMVGNLPKIHAFLRIRLRDYGVLDFDAGDARRQPLVDTTWKQLTPNQQHHEL